MGILRKCKAFFALPLGIELNQVPCNVLDATFRPSLQSLPVWTSELTEFWYVTFFRGVFLYSTDIIEVDVENPCFIVEQPCHFLFDTPDVKLLQSIKLPDTVVDMNDEVTLLQGLEFPGGEPFEVTLPGHTPATVPSEDFVLGVNRKGRRWKQKAVMN